MHLSPLMNGFYSDQDVQYDAHHWGDSMLLALRDKARPNSEVLLASMSDLHTAAAARASDPSLASAIPPLKVLMPHNNKIKLDGLSVSKDFAVVFKREGGLQKASVHRLPPEDQAPDSLSEGGADIEFPEPAYSLEAGKGGGGGYGIKSLHACKPVGKFEVRLSNLKFI
jgi:protease II